VKPGEGIHGKGLNEADRREDAKYQDDIKLCSIETGALVSIEMEKISL